MNENIGYGQTLQKNDCSTIHFIPVDFFLFSNALLYKYSFFFIYTQISNNTHNKK